MTNWPPTCAACGAPVMGGRCPRCRKEERPLGGKITYSGLGQVGPVVLDTADFVNKGVSGADAGDGTPPLVISDVSATAGYLLVAYVVIFSDGSVTPAITVLWGSEPMVDLGTIDGFLTTRSVLCKEFLLPITTLNQGTRSISVENDEAGTLRAYTLVFAMKNRTTVDAQAESENSVPDPGPMTATLDTNTANTKVMFFTFAENETSERGVYSVAGGSLEFSLEMTGGINPGWFSANVYDQATSSPVTYEKMLLANRAWFTHAMAIK